MIDPQGLALSAAIAAALAPRALPSPEAPGEAQLIPRPATTIDPVIAANCGIHLLR